jgi:hypothetical protein
MIRRLRLWLTGSDRTRGPITADRHKAMVVNAWWSVRVFYAATFFLAYSEATALWNLANSGAPLQARWVVAWMPDTLTGGTIATIAYLLAGIAGLLFMRHRWARILVCLALLQAAGFRYSFGGLNHGYHFWIWVSFCLCFLPDG